MLFKPPLTRERLHDIGVRKNPHDIVELLWEIKRLRALALKIGQVQRSITVSGGTAFCWSRCARIFETNHVSRRANSSESSSDSEA